MSVLLIDLPGYFLGASTWVVAIASIAILLTVLGIWCTAPLLSRTRGADAAAPAAS